jgi:hypothetical protein
LDHGLPAQAVDGIMQRDLHTLRAANPGYQDRRTTWRYPLQLEVHYRFRKRDRLVGEGSGKTVNISSKGLLLALSGQMCPRGTALELSIHWPAVRQPSSRQWLNVVGEVLRTDAHGVAVRIARYDFSSPSEDDASAEP